MIVEELAQFLSDQEIGKFDTEGGTGNVFVEHLPDKPDAAIGLYSSGGQTADVKTSLSRPQVTIRVRGDADPRTAGGLAESVHSALHGLRQTYFVEGGARICLCAARQSAPVHMGTDQNGRHEYSIELRIIAEDE